MNVGNSVIVAPGGRILAGPVACEEKIIYAEIDPVWARGSKFSLDVAGHYARPDVFQLTVNRDAERDDQRRRHGAGDQRQGNAARRKPPEGIEGGRNGKARNVLEDEGAARQGRRDHRRS